MLTYEQILYTTTLIGIIFFIWYLIKYRFDLECLIIDEVIVVSIIIMTCIAWTKILGDFYAKY